MRDDDGGHIESISSVLEGQIEAFVSAEGIDLNLSGTERRRLRCIGVKNAGFIDQAFDIAADNEGFMPRNLSLGELRDKEARLERLKQLMLVSRQLEQLAANAYAVQSDVCYRDALRVYGSLREQAAARVPGAEELFRALATFFRKRRRAGAEPTMRELERDFKKLVHGKADGEIVVENG